MSRKWLSYFIFLFILLHGFLGEMLFPNENKTKENVVFDTKIAWVDMGKLYRFCVEDREIKRSLEKRKELYITESNLKKKTFFIKKKLGTKAMFLSMETTEKKMI